MPAFLNHYACGIKGFHSLREGKLKDAIRRHPGVYAVGLAGPDLFFYSLGEYLHRGMTVGRVMHKYRTGLFFQAMFDEAMKRKGEDLLCALSYVSGFTGHYALDANAHYLVYKICDVPDQKIALGKHFRYEAAMDVFTCRYNLGREINDSRQMALIRTTLKEKRVIAQLLSASIAKVYPDLGHTYSRRRIRLILDEYFLISGLLIDPSGFKEFLFCTAETFFRGYPLMSPLFINGRTYGLTGKDWEKFHIRFLRGVKMYRKLLPLLEAAAFGADPDEEAYRTARRKLFDGLGSWSYHGFYHEEASSGLSLPALEEMMFQREAKGIILP